MISAGEFLALTQAGGNGNRAQSPVRLATIDPAYVSPGAPKVTFDGETTLSTRSYTTLGGYSPIPGDRVLLVRTGNTWLIVGGLAEPGGTGDVQANLDAHIADTTSVHGITDTAALETTAGAQAKADTVQTNLNSHTGATSVHSATSSATASRIILRDPAGRAKVAEPFSSTDIATKNYVDTQAPGQISAACKIRSSVSQSLTTGVVTTLSFNTTDYDTHGSMDDLANNRIVIQTAGIYSLKGSVRMNPPDGARCQVRFIINSGTAYSAYDDRTAPSGACGFSSASDYLLAVGDTVQLGVYQDGSTISDSPLDDMPSLSVSWVAPAP